MCCSGSRPAAWRREHLDGQLETRTDVLRWKGLMYPWEALLLEPANTPTSFFTGNPLRRQQEKVTFVRDSNCNSVALTLSRAAQIAHAQALGSCPFHSTENIKNIRVLSRTKPQLLWAQTQLVPRHCIAFQPVWAAVRCRRRFSGNIFMS